MQCYYVDCVVLLYSLECGHDTISAVWRSEDKAGVVLSTECDVHFITGGPPCVSHHGEFALLCLQPAVLRNVLVCMNDTRADNWDIQQNR